MKINNPIGSKLFSFFSLPIRVLYCKLGPISKIANKLLFWKLYSSNFDELDKIFEDAFSTLKREGFDIQGKTVMELGSGNSYINAYNFLMKGAKKIILVDKYSRQIKNRKQKIFFKKELTFLKNKYKKEKLFFLDEKGKIDLKYIEFHEKELIEMNQVVVDIIFSVSVLEHIKSIKENIKAMARIIKTDGLMFHAVDLRDHYNFNDPFLFYKYSDRIWGKYLTREGFSYTNRWRVDDYRRAFKENRFHIIHEEFTKKQLPKKINNKFRQKKTEDLRVATLKIILKKD